MTALGDGGYSDWLRERLMQEGIRLREPPSVDVPNSSAGEGEAERPSSRYPAKQLRRACYGRMRASNAVTRAVIGAEYQ